MQKKVSSIVWGLILIIAGVMLAGQIAGLWDVSMFITGWFPVIIILVMVVPAIISVFSKGPNGWNIFRIIFGIMLFALTSGYMSGEMFGKLTIPAIILSIGAGLILQNIFSVSGKKIIIPNAGTLNEDVAFSGKKLAITDKFAGLNGSASFGNLTVDLKNAQIDADVSMNLMTSFGGIKVFAPADVNVVCHSTCLFGGCSCNHKNTPGAKTIYINGFTVFGGIEVIG